jgi:2-polyprenyl-3-methyl-5-hydroxy-6-metoxy-1,4-benzoquinol methylase
MSTTVSPRKVPRGADFSGMAAESHRPKDEKGVAYNQLYDGLPVLAAGLDVHELAFEMFSRHVPKSARILDVGAGAGSFCKRLLNQGYREIEAVEINTDWFQVPGIPVHALDLQKEWADQLPEPAFDVVVTIEVIEHLENPWHFARQCARAVKPGGLILLSTPNIQSTRSRIQFLFDAEFRFFRQKDFEAVGHMTSLTQNQIRQVFESAGCERVESSHSGHKGIPSPKSAKKAVRAAFYALTYPFMRGPKHGEEGLYIFRKAG